MMLFFYTFFAGLTAVLAPCVWPVALGFIGIALYEKTSRVALPGVCFVLAFGSIGALFQLHERFGPVSFATAQTIFGLVILAMAGWMGARFFRSHTPIDPALTPTAHSVRATIRGCIVAIALGAAWSPCWGAVFGTVYTIVQSGDYAEIGMILMGAYGFGAVLAAGFIGVVLRDFAWRLVPIHRQRWLPVVAVVCVVLAGAGYAFGFAQGLAAWMIPFAPFVFFSL